MPMVAIVSANIVHVGLCFLFLDYYDMGIKGLALATSIKDGVALISIIIYMRCSPKISKILRPIDKKSFKGWGQYLKISMPCTIMLCGEWFAFEIITVLAGRISVADLACLPDSCFLDQHDVLSGGHRTLRVNHCPYRKLYWSEQRPPRQAILQTHHIRHCYRYRLNRYANLLHKSSNR